MTVELLERIDRIAAARPSAVALASAHETVRYSELVDRSRMRAAALRAEGLEAGQAVVVAMDNTPEAVCLALACWRVGAVMVPVDPTDPVQRIEQLVTPIRPALFVVRRPDVGLAPAGIRVRALDDLVAAIDGRRDADPSAADVAYVLSTSGTTGVPKRVRATHANFAYYLRAITERVGVTPDDVVSCLDRLSFGISMFEIFGTLWAGATCRLFSKQELLDPSAIVARLDGVTCLHAVPTLLGRLIDEPAWGASTAALRQVFVGGERVPPELVDALRTRRPDVRCWVFYGCTEVTSLCSAGLVDAPMRPGQLGPALAGTEVVVCTPEGDRVGPDEEGEIWVAGPGVATECLVDERWYRTGDLARVDSDGTVRLLGRADRQVKIRGHRVAVDEVEATLGRHPDVREAAVVARSTGEGVELWAWVVVDTSHDTVARWLARKLPSSMLPARWVVVDRLPTNRNGKVDRARLRTAEAPVVDDRDDSAEGLRPWLAATWANALGLASVGPREDFFDLGGHSLVAVALCSAIRDRLDLDVSVATLFECRTVERVAAHIEAQGYTALPSRSRSESVRL